VALGCRLPPWNPGGARPWNAAARSGHCPRHAGHADHVAPRCGSPHAPSAAPPSETPRRCNRAARVVGAPGSQPRCFRLLLWGTLPCAGLLPLLPKQAGCRSPVPHRRFPTRAHPFPQHVWTTAWRTPWRGRGPSRCRRPRKRRRAPRAGAAHRWRRTVAGGRRSCLRGGPETAGRAAVSRPVCIALWRLGRMVARAAGPRHCRPRLCHRPRRRGAASAASRPTQSSRTSGHHGTPASAAPQTRPCSGCDGIAARLPPRTVGLPGDVLAPRRRGKALEQPLRLAAPCRIPGTPYVFVPAACSRLCLALPCPHRRRCGPGSLAPHVPAITCARACACR
jgi:hypothetical protein